MSKKYQIQNNCKKYNFEQGKNGLNDYCKTCSKTVADLSMTKSSDLFGEVKKHENTCVSIKSSQLHFVNSIMNQKSKVAALALAATMFSSSCNRNMAKSETEEENRYEISTVQNASQEKNLISGIILDQETKEGLILATIYLKDSKVGTNTNSFGKFDLTIPDEFLEDGKIFISYIGYKTLEIDVKEITGKHIRIYLSDDDVMIIGYIETTE